MKLKNTLPRLISHRAYLGLMVPGKSGCCFKLIPAVTTGYSCIFKNNPHAPPHLFELEAVAQDVVHVLMQALKTPVAGPHVRVVGEQQPFNSRF